jgi:putative FmdB family regulatory protein
MPTYEYICKNCGHTFEELQSIKADPLRRCPKCQKETLARVLGGGTGLIFKGTGFYQTDYNRGSAPAGHKKKARKEEVKKEDGKKEEGKKGDVKKETSTPATPPAAKKKSPGPTGTDQA